MAVITVIGTLQSEYNQEYIYIYIYILFVYNLDVVSEGVMLSDYVSHHIT